MRQYIFMMIIHCTYVAQIVQCFEPVRLPYVFVKELTIWIKKNQLICFAKKMSYYDFKEL